VSRPGLAIAASVMLPRAAVLAAALGGSPTPLLAQQSPPDATWSMHAGNPQRTSIASTLSPSTTAAAWTFATDSQGRAITFPGGMSPVCTRDRVFAIGSVVISAQKQYFLFAVDRRTGTLAWSRQITNPVADSWSPPIIDERNGTVITTTNKLVAAYELSNGSPRWSVTLARTIVNASALITTDLGVSNRLFITQYDGFGSSGLLTCINIDPQFGIANPYAPGHVLWSAPIGGSSGNSPAYVDGVVYCTSVGELDVYGQVQAFDARSITEPAPLWTQYTDGHNFFGGCSIRADSDGLWLFAASYAFAGNVSAARLYKFNALSGDIVWNTSANRTCSTPIPLDDGRILLAGGLWGYGTIPSLEIFVDHGPTVTRAWHSVLDTWQDSDLDSIIDAGEFFAVGGWNQQPITNSVSDQIPRELWLGALPSSPETGASYAALHNLDLTKLPPIATLSGPSDRSFVIATRAGAGASPCPADRSIYSTGTAGLTALGPIPGRYDINNDGRVDIDDLYAWTQGIGQRDTDLDGDVDQKDQADLVAQIRRDEDESRRTRR
jgi:outer membrane protein assembly factor BamB